MKIVKDFSTATAPIIIWATLQGVPMNHAIANYPPTVFIDYDSPREINKLRQFEVQHLTKQSNVNQELLKIGNIRNITGWVRSFQIQLNNMRSIPDNWNGCGSKSPNSRAIRNMQDVIDIIYEKELTPVSLTPSADDGIGLTFVVGEKWAIIECSNEGNIVAVIYEGNGEPDVWEVGSSLSEIKDSVDKIFYFIQGMHNTRRDVS